ncbi:hypothetical protein KAFR_0E03510 [Kazachstania africana CBS 2517]|uniref:Spore wall maturation protein DIT1 n=1 Tax=Kazachstania africana (strain ATCC 22294 / BCRC 22015 / CBS 2517 / CECT 1963 / NBRC 1671 / NRRL Y-8276) TaxID=1071382 RepID=H2AVV2_KAZAF|nr:hypothetical protein KAFR_0E03510 [Kazachstania africana CBS 2517]CCF58502.1 hypothetical protein KAFR_0E03510 [Kazachstania africana CBS 2517]
MTLTEKTPQVVETDKVSNFPQNVPIPHQKDKDMSTYSKFLAIYTRHPETQEIYCIEEKQGCKFEENWEDFKKFLTTEKFSYSSQTTKIKEYVVDANSSKIFSETIELPFKISEYKRDGENQIRGCVTTIEDENDFNDWFVFHILDQSRMHNHEKSIDVEVAKVKYHEIFTDYFASNLKNTIVGDEWEKGGRDYFIDRVKYFTDRYLRIECILPAFPCKSSNQNKVNGTMPDKGEELALRRLIKATTEVSKVYPPGMKVWIVSDGHVFSDCIGVDDDIVSTYTGQLHTLYETIKSDDSDPIGFCGLNDLFFTGLAADLFDPNWVSDLKLPHYTGTKICSVSELSRQILMKGCDTDDGRLKTEINIPGHPRLYLYRGFSKFMAEDLSLLPYFSGCSRKGFKKTVSKIAFNMIRRNDAYSNLVELVFPNYVRISIHAHTNKGPKYGIKVISTNQCRTVKSLEDINAEPTFEDLLHIPTPWHNCVVKVENSSDGNIEFFLTKSKIVKDGLESGKFQGAWKETCIENGEGGYYSIVK